MVFVVKANGVYVCVVGASSFQATIEKDSRAARGLDLCFWAGFGLVGKEDGKVNGPCK